MDNDQLYWVGRGIDDVRKSIAILALLLMAAATGPCAVRPISNYSERRMKQARLYVSEEQNMVKLASPGPADFLPIRGNDYDKDGLLDKVERRHYGPRYDYRTPYISWYEIERSSPLFIKLQEEYTSLLEQEKN